ncbi:Retrograde regulation protein [Spathaspora sp. JA1]|nr:Retrograde regulation protein [Spathaspora sp. JA1]
MEDYLKDSPSDYNAATETDTPNYKYNLPITFNLDNLTSQSTMSSSHPQSQPQQQQQNNANFSNNNPNSNEFSFNLNIAGFNNDSNPAANSNANTNSGFNSQLGSNEYLSPTGFTYNAGTTGSESNTYPGSPGSFTNEPFLDDIDNVAFSQAVLAPQLSNTDNPTLPQQQQQQPQLQSQQQPHKQSHSPIQPLSPHQQFGNSNTSANLDELISPPNTTGGFDATSPFLNPQYFSPPTRQGGYNPLNSIAENPLASPYSVDAFSPDISRNGSISGPPGYTNGSNQLDITTTGTYLSPQFNPGYSSPPIYDSYLQSPPPSSSQYPNRSGTNSVTNMSTSIPARSEWHHHTLSPPPQSAILSTSVPNSGNSSGRATATISKEGIPTKQLSKEEKAKRRREFHNAVERRRRDLIKERIKELGVIVPPSLLNPQLSAVQALQRKSSIDSTDLTDLIGSIKVKETKPNKSTILNKAVDYINHLNYVLSQQEFVREQLISQIEVLEKSLNENDDLSSGGGYPDTSTNSQSPQAYYMESNNANSGNANFLGSTDIPIYNPDEFFSDINNNNQRY